MLPDFKNSNDFIEKLPDPTIKGTIQRPVVLSVAHSGTLYPNAMCELSRLSITQLRAFEDPMVDDLWQQARGHFFGLKMHLARAFLDLNRSHLEWDPLLVAGGLPPGSLGASFRVKAGLGVVPRLLGGTEPIYRQKLDAAYMTTILSQFYHPYHHALDSEIKKAQLLGPILLIDAHSMPKRAGFTRREKPVDIVIGDLWGEAASEQLSAAFVRFFQSHGLKVARNDPFAGGHILSRHAAPKKGIEGVQIELNRALYWDENAHAPNENYPKLKAIIGKLIECLKGGASFF